ncbi:MAG: hypothetical protein FWD51_04185 [Betaproteobacteria bacterium]|nr:hypothetical protein [Betaproteobacteria bacterium]
MNVCKTDSVRDTTHDAYTMFVLSMIMASVLTVPVIIGTAQAAAMWRILRKSFD